MLDYGCDVQEAIDMPRGLHYEGVYQLEDGVPAEIVEGLKKLGHKTTSVVGPLGGGSGDLDRLGQGHADRRFRSAQGRLRAGVLRARRQPGTSAMTCAMVPGSGPRIAEPHSGTRFLLGH